MPPWPARSLLNRWRHHPFLGVKHGDFAGRFGGEEFLILLPDTGLDGAAHVAEKIRSTVASISVPGVERDITSSLGIADLLDTLATQPVSCEKPTVPSTRPKPPAATAPSSPASGTRTRLNPLNAQQTSKPAPPIPAHKPRSGDAFGLAERAPAS
jgi:Diguanylate cyclase, GGDEF domain